MSNFICLSILVLICVFGIFCGSGGLLMGVQEKDDIYHKDTANGTIITGVVILVISLVGFGFLGEPFTDALNDTLNEKIESGTKYKAVHQDEIKSFVSCYKEKGYNVCKTKGGDEMVVEHYWKKGKTKKKEGNQALKYNGIKDSEIKKYTGCEDDGDNKVCTAEDGTKEKVETYWKMERKDGNEKD